jgi:hypothetical protein
MSLSVRLTGSKEEIEQVLIALKTQGYRWEGNSKYYPQRGENSKFSYYLNNFVRATVVPMSTNPDISTPVLQQPRPYDAVLGSNRGPGGDS